MKTKVYLSLFIITAVTSVVLLVFSLLLANSICVFDTAAKKRDLSSFMDGSYGEGIDCNNGFVPDAQTAARIGGAVIDHLCGKDITDLGDTLVYYDENNRVWEVIRVYDPFSPSALVIIDQDTGEILDAWYQED